MTDEHTASTTVVYVIDRPCHAEMDQPCRVVEWVDTHGAPTGFLWCDTHLNPCGRIEHRD